MSVSGPTYGPGQREVWYGTVQQAEAAARDFQQRGYRRRTRSLAPGDVLVAETTEGFSVFWIPQDETDSPSPGGRESDGGGGQGVRSKRSGRRPSPKHFTPRPLAGEGPGVRVSGRGGGTGKAGSRRPAR